MIDGRNSSQAIRAFQTCGIIIKSYTCINFSNQAAISQINHKQDSITCGTDLIIKVRVSAVIAISKNCCPGAILQFYNCWSTVTVPQIRICKLPEYQV